MNLGTLLGKAYTALDREAQRRLTPKVGWIGLDLGRDSFKLAQVERSRAGWRFASRWSAYDEAVVDENPNPALLEAHTSAVGAARAMFKGRETAVCLSPTFAPIRSLQLPGGTPEELCAMMQEEFADDELTERREVDAWPAFGCKPPEGQSRWMASSVSHGLVNRLSTMLQAERYHTQVVDVAPTALARALALSDPEDTRPIAALDLGARCAMLTVARLGEPGYCRMLRGCGTASFVQPLCEKLKISTSEAWYVLREQGTSAADQGAGPSSLQQLLTPAVERLGEELRRTLAFLRQEYAGAVPATMQLFGGGALIRNLATRLEQAVGLPTRVWNILGDDRSRATDDAIFGAAAGLSALAWEVR